MKFPLLGIMFLIFMTLKLIGVITWSWVWVSAPIWIPIVIGILVIFALFSLKMFCNYLDKK